MPKKLPTINDLAPVKAHATKRSELLSRKQSASDRIAEIDALDLTTMRLDVQKLLDPQAAAEREAIDTERAALAAEVEAIDEALTILKAELDAASESVMPELVEAYRPRQRELDDAMWQAAEALVTAHHSADEFRQSAVAAGVRLPHGGSHRVGHWYSDGLQDHLTVVPDVEAAIAARKAKS